MENGGVTKMEQRLKGGVLKKNGENGEIGGFSGEAPRMPRKEVLDCHERFSFVKKR